MKSPRRGWHGRPTSRWFWQGRPARKRFKTGRGFSPSLHEDLRITTRAAGYPDEVAAAAALFARAFGIARHDA